MIIGSQCFICVFAVLIKVSLQVTGFIGGSVVLLCSSTEHLERQDINVFWRHNDSKIVFDIINGNGSVVGQDLQYKNRVKPLYKDYVKRNFSIRLNNLQPSDAGEFSCLSSLSDKPQTVQLIVEESTYQENQGDYTETSTLFWVGILTAVVIIGFIAIFFIIYKKKKSQASPVSALETYNSYTTEMSGL